MWEVLEGGHGGGYESVGGASGSGGFWGGCGCLAAGEVGGVWRGEEEEDGGWLAYGMFLLP